ncbi:MAG: sugar ABC transporter permease [Chloroflexota bacterium]
MATTSSVENSTRVLPSAPRTRQPSLWQRLWKSRTSYLMLLVFFVPFTIFSIYPIINSAYLSMTDYSGSPNKPLEFLGTANFGDLLRLEVITLPRSIDEETGEVLFRCGRKNVLGAEVAALVADGATCNPAYESARGRMSEGFQEWRTVFTNGQSEIIIGAIDPRFWTAIYNTAVYVLVTVVIRLVLGLALALILQHQSRRNMILRTIFFLPSVTAGIAVTIVWGWIFRGQSYGLINSVRLQLGATEIIPFLNDPNWSLPILMFLAVWGGIGYNMILYLAGLQSIGAEYYEAATVDGAKTRDKFWYITLPLLRPTTIFLVITGVIGSFQVFDTAYILYASAGQGMGGPLDSALTVVGYLYERGFRLFQLGYASAIAWILFIVIFIFTLINLRVGRGNEGY